MERRDIEEIERFLTSVGQSSLHAYYGVSPDAPAEDLEAAVKRRRAWAQGQQANPKFKNEALFLIKQHAMLRRALVEEPESLRSLEAGVGRSLDALTAFIKGAVADGVLTAAAEAAVRHQGRQLRLADTAISQRIHEVLEEVGALRTVGDRDDIAETAAATDLYAVLDVRPDATQAQLEAAYRARYKWARNLADLIRSQMLLKDLDEAWRVLREPARRARYDEARARGRVPESLPEGADLPVSDLPPPLPSAPTVVWANREPPELAGVFRRPEEPPAPAPRGISGRTLGVADGPQTVRARVPRLQVGTNLLVVRRSARAARLSIRVRNDGQGPMPGRVTTDAPWIELPNPLLDAARADQEVPVLVHTDRAPAGVTGGTITVSTEHGERKSVTVRVPSAKASPLLLLVALFALGVAGVALAWWWLGQRTLLTEAELVLDVDPVADHVYVDGVDRGAGRHVTVRLGPSDVPVLVRVEADGFLASEEKLDLQAGQRYVRAVRLELDDPMDWSPPPSVSPTMLGEDGARAVQERSAVFRDCFTWAGAPVNPRFHYTAMLDGAGQVRKVTIEAENFTLEPALACLRRGFRGLRLAPVANGYAVIQGELSLGAQGTAP